MLHGYEYITMHDHESILIFTGQGLSNVVKEAVWKAGQETPPNLRPDHEARVWILQYPCDDGVDLNAEGVAQPRGPLVVKLHGLSQLRASRLMERR